MPPGKPFTKVTDAQRDLFNAELKEDAFSLLKRAAGGGLEYLRENPQSPIRQTVEAVERDTGAVTMLVKIAHAYAQEREVEKAEAAAKAAAPKPESAAGASKSTVVDAEFEEE